MSASRYFFARSCARPGSAIRSAPDSLVTPKNGACNYKIAQVVKSSAAKKLIGFMSKLSAICFAIWMLSGFASPVSAMSKAATTVSGDITAAGGGLSAALRFILHLDKELAILIATYGKTTYAILFGIVFCETGPRRRRILTDRSIHESALPSPFPKPFTGIKRYYKHIYLSAPGLVITPFLPGDSLLFACGALAALGSLQLPLTLAIFAVAAVRNAAAALLPRRRRPRAAARPPTRLTARLHSTPRPREPAGGRARARTATNHA